MERFVIGLALMLVAEGPVVAQQSPSTPLTIPCGDTACPNEDAATLKAAYMSSATTAAERTKMLAVIAAHTTLGLTDWAAARAEYFSWRRSGLSESQRTLEDGLKENARRDAAKRANEDSREFRRQIGGRLTSCVSRLVFKNLDQPYLAEDVAREISSTCIMQVKSDIVTTDDAVAAAIESKNTPEMIAEVIRLARRPKVILNQ